MDENCVKPLFFCKGKEQFKTSKRENLVTWHKFTFSKPPKYIHNSMIAQLQRLPFFYNIIKREKHYFPFAFG